MRTLYQERFSIIQKEYIEKNKSIKEVAKILNIPKRTLNDFLYRHKICKRKKYGNENIEKLKYEYLVNNKTRDEIQQLFNISRGRLIYLFNKHNIQKIFIDNNVDYKQRDWLYREYILKKRSTIDIANQFSVQPKKIYYWLVSNNIVPRTRPESRHNYAGNNISLNKYIQDFINGEILGDGHLSANNFSALYKHASKYKNYILWMKKVFDTHNIKSGKVYDCIKYINDKKCKYYSFSTLSYTEFKNIHTMFYPSGYKIIPESLNITPIVLRQWFIGDGSYTKNKTKIGRATIATYGFDSKSLDIAIKKLKKNNINAKKSKGGLSKKGIQRYIIRIESTNNFFKFIGPCPKKIEQIYGYKWPDKKWL